MDSSIHRNNSDFSPDLTTAHWMSPVTDEQQNDGQNRPTITESVEKLCVTSEPLAQSPPKAVQPVRAHQVNDDVCLSKTLSAESQALQPSIAPHTRIWTIGNRMQCRLDSPRINLQLFRIKKRVSSRGKEQAWSSHRGTTTGRYQKARQWNWFDWIKLEF